MIEQALVSVENLAFISALRNSTFMYPLVNAGHILGVSMLVGGIVPLAFVCGVLLFATAAVDYAGSLLFQAKIALVLLGVSNALILGRVMRRRDIRSLPMTASMPAALRAGAALSLVVWISVLILGRLLGYF